MENVVTLDFTVVSHSFLSNVLYMRWNGSMKTLNIADMTFPLGTIETVSGNKLEFYWLASI